MSTIYTVNGKVLKNAANDKWLKKKEIPLFVMDASNATYIFKSGVVYVRWQSPAYPDEYNGNGKQYILVNNNSTAPNAYSALLYSNDAEQAGPTAIPSGMNVLGESTGVLSNNAAMGYGFGTCLMWANPLNFTTVEEAQAYMANVSITIVDP